MVPRVAAVVAEARASGLCRAVWLFGSFAWDAPREGCDLDLLVDGDAEAVAARVRRACGREVHAIALAEAPDSLRARARTREPHVNAAESRRLWARAEIERDWGAAEARLADVKSVDGGAGPAEAALVALSLDHAYQAFESLLSRFERALGLPERAGGSWDRARLADAAVPAPGLRPALFPPDAEAGWDALLGSRHCLRHAYSVPLDAGKLGANVARLERAVLAAAPRVRASLDALGPAGD